MSKAVLFMDMPSSCEKCRLHSFVGKDCDVICVVKGKTQSYEEAYKSKPDWCPLKPMPNKIGIASALKMPREGNIIDVINSYNACINDILRGSE